MSEIDKSTGDVVDTHKKTKDKMVESIELLNISSKVMVVAVVLHIDQSPQERILPSLPTEYVHTPTLAH
jgi:hypothetical protein